MTFVFCKGGKNKRISAYPKQEPKIILKMSSMNFIQLTEQKLDVNEISERVADECCGAISLFVGITRDNFEDKKVGQLI